MACSRQCISVSVGSAQTAQENPDWRSKKRSLAAVGAGDIYDLGLRTRVPIYLGK